MTLGEFIQYLSENPFYIISFFVFIPLTAALAGWIGKGEGHLSPWKYLYSTLVYLVCVPGIFAVTLNVYLFLFERRSVMDTDIYTQVLPILSMIITLILIRNTVSLDKVPGFGKLSGLMIMIFVTISLMWFIDRTRIYVFAVMKFQSLLIIFAVLLLIFRYGLTKLIRPKAA